MATRRCVFCNTGEVSGEHVWPDWMHLETQRRFESGGWWNVKRLEGTFKYKRLKARVRRICKQCNNTWMSVMETETKPILIPMMFGDEPSIELSPESQGLLAAWAFKTALMADFLYSGEAIDPAVYSRFFASHVPPKHCTIWTGAYGGRERKFTTNVNQVTISTPNQFNRDGILGTGWSRTLGTSATLVAIRAVFQVVIYQGYDMPMRSVEDGRLLHRIWPTATTSVSWPAQRMAFSDKSLAAFMNQSRGIEPSE